MIILVSLQEQTALSDVLQQRALKPQMKMWKSVFFARQNHADEHGQAHQLFIMEMRLVWLAGLTQTTEDLIRGENKTGNL